MKIIKPLLFYILSLLSFLLILFIINKASVTHTLELFSNNYIYFNILFTSLYFFLNSKYSFGGTLLVGLFAVFITILLSETIYPNVLKSKIILPEANLTNKIITNNDNSTKDEFIFVLNNNLDKAKYYYELNDYSSAWIYADLYIDNGGKKKYTAEDIKEKSEKSSKDTISKIENPKYIDTLIYKKMILQNKYIDAYYFCMENINNVVYDYDFLIKYKNSYKELLRKYYSIDYVSSALSLPGYTDIQFYYTKDKIKKYTIDKLVERKGEYFLQNLYINDELYPYIYINNKGDLFASGFKEDRKYIIEKNSPEIPIDIEDLKLFSNEYYQVAYSSLCFNLKIYDKKNIKYIKNSELSNLIISRLTGYLTLLILFFMAYYFVQDRSYLNHLFEYSVVMLFTRWFIKKIGLILLYSGLNLAITIIMLLYIIWYLILINRSKLLLSRF